jgi:hypothetical protein
MYVWCFQFPHIHDSSSHAHHFYSSYSSGCEAISHFGYDLHFPTSDVKHILHACLSLINSLTKWLCKAFFILNCANCLYWVISIVYTGKMVDNKHSLFWFHKWEELGNRGVITFWTWKRKKKRCDRAAEKHREMEATKKSTK